MTLTLANGDTVTVRVMAWITPGGELRRDLCGDHCWYRRISLGWTPLYAMGEGAELQQKSDTGEDASALW